VLHLRNNNSTSSSSFDSIFNIPARLNFILQKNLVEMMIGYVSLCCLLSHLWRGGKEVRILASPSISLSDREGAVLHLRNNNSTSSSSFDSIFNNPARLNYILRKIWKR
jgi:hypothetical protein